MDSSAVRTASLAALAGSCFGALPAIMIKAYESGVTPVTYVLMRGAGAGAVLLTAFVASSGPAPRYRPERLQHTRAELLAAPVLYAGFSLSYFSSIRSLPVSIACLIFYTYPLLVLVATALLEGQTPTRPTALLHVSAFAGILLSIGAGGPEIAASAASAGGVASACCSSFCFAGYALCAGRVAAAEVPPLLSASVTNLGQAALLGAVVLVAAAAAGAGGGGALSWGLPGANHANGAAFTCAAIALYVCAQFALFFAFSTAERATTVTFFLNAEPLVSVVLAVACLGEPFTWPQWAGLAVLVSSLSLSSYLGDLAHPAAAANGGAEDNGAEGAAASTDPSRGIAELNNVGKV